MTWTRRTPTGGLLNTHARTTSGPIEQAGLLLDALTEPGNPVWPGDR